MANSGRAENGLSLSVETRVDHLLSPTANRATRRAARRQHARTRGHPVALSPDQARQVDRQRPDQG